MGQYSTKTLPRKITNIAAGKLWKANLRLACLERARRRNRMLQHDDIASPMVKLTTPYGVRQIVEEELRHQEVQIRASWFSDDHSTENHQTCDDSCTGNMVITVDDRASVDASGKLNEPTAQHWISEEELYKLLEEVEQEMDREQDLLVDDIMQRAENERRYLEEQVHDYEQWEEIMDQQHDDVVPCPVCHADHLSVTDNGQTIICPNTMDGSCSLIIPCDSTRRNNEPVALHELQAILQQAYEAHSLHCQHFLTFHMHDGHLCANCSACAGSVQLV